MLPGDGEQVVHDEQEDRVAQDEGHLEGGAVHAVGRQHEAEEIQRDEEAAGDQQVHHVEGRPPFQNDLREAQKNNALRFKFSMMLEVGYPATADIF